MNGGSDQPTEGDAQFTYPVEEPSEATGAEQSVAGEAVEPTDAEQIVAEEGVEQGGVTLETAAGETYNWGYPGYEDLNVTWDCNWMSYLPDDAKLNELSIPGAHDATACNTENEIYGNLVAPFAQTQNQYIWGLLTSGTRHFDLRINKYGDDLAMCHGSIDMYDMEGNRLLLDSVLDDMQYFLGKHDGETLILQIKCDGDNCDPEIYNYFKALVAEQPDLIYCGDHVPTLGEARGRLVILSRLQLIGSVEGVSETVPEYTSRRQRLYRLDDGTYWAFDVGLFKGGDTTEKSMALTAEFNGTEVWTEDMYDVPRGVKNTYVGYSLTGEGKAENQGYSATYRKNDARDRGGDAWSIIYSSMSYQDVWGTIEDILTFGDIDNDLIWPFQGAEFMNPILKNTLAYNPSLYTGCLVGDFYDTELLRLFLKKRRVEDR